MKNEKMFKYLALTALLFCFSFSFAQEDTLQQKPAKKNRYVIWAIPSEANNIYGLAIGPTGSEVLCYATHTKRTHGINFQLLGQGFFQIFNAGRIKQADLHNDSLFSSATDRVQHNGLLLSPFGTFTDHVNGISFSLWMSTGRKINGLSFNLLWNLYQQINGISIGIVNQTAITNGIQIGPINQTAKLKGVQIGLINKTTKLKGIQIGLWNESENGKFPFINWNF